MLGKISVATGVFSQSLTNGSVGILLLRVLSQETWKTPSSLGANDSSRERHVTPTDVFAQSRYFLVSFDQSQLRELSCSLNHQIKIHFWT